MQHEWMMKQVLITGNEVPMTESELETLVKELRSGKIWEKKGHEGVYLRALMLYSMTNKAV